MNYAKVYEQLINKAKDRGDISEYTEVHHIIPRCLGGSNDKDNLIRLTGREHFIAHWLLHSMYPANDKLFYAFLMMTRISGNQNRYTPSSRVIAYLRKESSERMLGKPGHWLGKKRENISGENHMMAKRPELKKQISDKLMGHEVSDISREKIRKAKLGSTPWNKGKTLQPLSEEHKDKLRIANTGKKGKPKTDEEREAIRKFQLENSSSAKQIVQKDIEGNIIEVFKTCKDAITKTGIKGIYCCLKGRRPTVKGFIWEYYKEN